MKITSASTIFPFPAKGPVHRACLALMRDIRKRCLPGQDSGASILLRKESLPAEAYRIHAENGSVVILAGDDLGMIYGLYRLSFDLLGIEPFWFWNDQPLIQQEACSVPDNYQAESKPAAVRYRGWFINDEVLLHAWKLEERAEDRPCCAWAATW